MQQLRYDFPMDMQFDQSELDFLGQKLPLASDLMPYLCRHELWQFMEAEQSVKISKAVEVYLLDWQSFLLSYCFIVKKVELAVLADFFKISLMRALRLICDQLEQLEFKDEMAQTYQTQLRSAFIFHPHQFLHKKISSNSLSLSTELKEFAQMELTTNPSLLPMMKDSSLAFKIRNLFSQMENINKSADPSEKKRWKKPLILLTFNRGLVREGLKAVFVFSFLFLLIAMLASINNILDENKINSSSFVSTALSWQNSGLKFKDENEIPTKEVKINQKKWEPALPQFVPLEFKAESGEDSTETEIFDTSVAVAGATRLGEDDFRDRYLGKAKAYRMMLNSADIFDSRLKLIELMKSYQAKGADGGLVGKESLGGVYFNFYVPSDRIKKFLVEVEGLFPSQIYISKTNSVPPVGTERVFLWLKKI